MSDLGQRVREVANELNNGELNEISNHLSAFNMCQELSNRGIDSFSTFQRLRGKLSKIRPLVDDIQGREAYEMQVYGPFIRAGLFKNKQEIINKIIEQQLGGKKKMKKTRRHRKLRKHTRKH